MKLSIENQRAHGFYSPSTGQSKHFVRSAMHRVMPVLLEIMSKQEEIDDEDSWNPPKAAKNCLLTLSSCIDGDNESKSIDSDGSFSNDPYDFMNVVSESSEATQETTPLEQNMRQAILKSVCLGIATCLPYIPAENSVESNGECELIKFAYQIKY